MATEAQFWGRSPEVMEVRRSRARIVRQALRALSTQESGNIDTSRALQTLATVASDEVLERLLRMLK